MEGGGQVLDVVAAHAQLGLAAAVGADPLLLAVVVGGAQRLQPAQPRGLHVHRLGRERQRLDVGHRVDRRVPGDAVVLALERLGRLGVVQVRILDPCIGERLGHTPVHVCVGDHVDRRALVMALEVHRVDRAGGGQLGHQLVGPGVGGIELEARAGVALQQRRQLLCRLGLTLGRRGQAHRDHVVQRPGSAPDHLAEGLAALAQRQVQRSRLEGPAAVVARGLAHRRRVREQVQAVDQLGQLAERGGTGQVQHLARILEGDVVELVVDHVLADAVLAATVEVDQRARADELGAHRLLESRQRIALDLDRQLRDGVPGAHDAGAYAGTTTTGVFDRWRSLCGVDPRIAPLSGVSP